MKRTTTQTKIQRAAAALLLSLCVAAAAFAAESRRTVIVLAKGGVSSIARLATPAAALRARTAFRPSARSLAVNAKNVKDLWIVNGYSMEVTESSLKELQNNPNVDVLENFEVRAPEVEIQSAALSLPMENWGLDRIGAKAAWAAFGVSGRGVRIGHLDTGVDASHPDLAGQVAAWAEFDASGNQVPSSPHDSGIHGTHTAGILVGGSASGLPIGVAPGAKLLSALVLNSNSGTLLQVLAGMQWVLDPDGDPMTDDGANVLSMSLGAAGQYQIFQTVTDLLLEAGVLPVFAIGNSGPGRLDAPGNCAGAVSVGATMYSNNAATFSGGGRITWNGQVYVKPEIAAPGYGIPSSIPNGRYQTMSGTSMATPHVAGAAALVLEANPSLTVERLREVLTSTARDLGETGIDDRTGAGLLDVAAALTLVTERSLVQGFAMGEGQPVPAAIRVKDAFGRLVQTVRADSETGRFEVSLNQGDYLIDASFGLARGVEQSVSVAKGAVVTVNFTMGQSSALENLLVYPNPYRPGTDGDVTFDGLPGDTRIDVYTISGEKVAEVSAGATGAALWDGRNTAGETLAAGAYLYVASHYDERNGWEHKKGTVAVLK